MHSDPCYAFTQCSILKDLCCDIILGHDFQKQNKRITFQYEGNQTGLEISGTDSLQEQ